MVSLLADDSVHVPNVDGTGIRPTIFIQRKLGNVHPLYIPLSCKLRITKSPRHIPLSIVCACHNAQEYKKLSKHKYWITYFVLQKMGLDVKSSFEVKYVMEALKYNRFI